MNPHMVNRQHWITLLEAVALCFMRKNKTHSPERKPSQVETSRLSATESPRGQSAALHNLA